MPPYGVLLQRYIASVSELLKGKQKNKIIDGDDELDGEETKPSEKEKKRKRLKKIKETMVMVSIITIFSLSSL